MSKMRQLFLKQAAYEVVRYKRMMNKVIFRAWLCFRKPEVHFRRLPKGFACRQVPLYLELFLEEANFKADKCFFNADVRRYMNMYRITSNTVNFGIKNTSDAGVLTSSNANSPDDFLAVNRLKYVRRVGLCGPQRSADHCPIGNAERNFRGCFCDCRSQEYPAAMNLAIADAIASDSQGKPASFCNASPVFVPSGYVFIPVVQAASTSRFGTIVITFWNSGAFHWHRPSSGPLWSSHRTQAQFSRDPAMTKLKRCCIMCRMIRTSTWTSATIMLVVDAGLSTVASCCPPLA